MWQEVVTALSVDPQAEVFDVCVAPVQGRGRLRLKSLGSALSFVANHPGALGDLLHALSVEEP